MNVLIVGSGAREHTIAWKIAQSAKLNNLFIAPGNPGTAKCGENLPIDIKDFNAVESECKNKHVDLVVVGPEVPLSEGINDHLSRYNIKVFGPTQAAARIESSKSFSKDFMKKMGIPTGTYCTVTDYKQGADYINRVHHPIVIKAVGLLAGKGVIVPETKEEALSALHDMLVEGKYGSAADEVVIEERLLGPEISLMAYSDGTSVKPMLPAQDHKRLLDGQKGPNTGGMGAYAPVTFCTNKLMEEILDTILQPAVDGLRAMGTPFVGVLYAGLMMTEQGPKTLEFNCRFGDPETQVILPLLDSDLLDILDACVEGHLRDTDIGWKNGSAVCVVMASEKYPDSSEGGRVIKGLDECHAENVEVFHAGTKIEGDHFVTAGGRVLGVTSWAENLRTAMDDAYQTIKKLNFQGMQYRHDIGSQGLIGGEDSSSAYAGSGVSIEAGNKSIKMITTSVKATQGKEVLSSIGSFGGLFDAELLKSMKAPVLVASTDGVGTKVKLAAATGRYQSIGMDIVNHCIDDILVQGARPLFFMDYYASSKLHPEILVEIVSGMSIACKAAGCALLGGETAEMPGVYLDGEFDVAGTIVGIVEKDDILPKASIQAGDVVIGLQSSGPHTNGYSLIREVFKDLPLGFTYPELGIPIKDAILQPHRSYLKLIQPILTRNNRLIKGIAHITGGGFRDNIPRVLPAYLDAVIDRNAWHVPPLYALIQEIGKISDDEMYRVFNMGIGMVLILEAQNAGEVQKMIPEETWLIGEIVKGSNKVIMK